MLQSYPAMGTRVAIEEMLKRTKGRQEGRKNKEKRAKRWIRKWGKKDRKKKERKKRKGALRYCDLGCEFLEIHHGYFTEISSVIKVIGIITD